MTGPPLTMIGSAAVSHAIVKKLIEVAFVFGISPAWAVQHWGMDNLEAVLHQARRLRNGR